MPQAAVIKHQRPEICQNCHRLVVLNILCVKLRGVIRRVIQSRDLRAEIGLLTGLLRLLWCCAPSNLPLTHRRTGRILRPPQPVCAAFTTKAIIISSRCWFHLFEGMINL
ncbi:MAG: hypothetical protein ACLVHV_15585, partial [Oscillospiraceae bacterium]